MALSRATKVVIATLMTGGSIIGIAQAVSSGTEDPILASFGDTDESSIIDHRREFLAGGGSQVSDDSAVLPESIHPRFVQDRSNFKYTPLKEIKELSEADRKLSKEKADSIYETLGDYSFKIFSPDCSAGTGWILDYQIPKDKNRYPTVWYIATNAHVIDNYWFSENDYGQILPRGDAVGIKEKRKKHPGIFEQLKKLRLDQSMGSKCLSPKNYGYLDIGLSKDQKDEVGRRDYGLFQQNKIKEPRLFFSAFNFLDKSTGVEDNHYTDFVVLEIEFTDEEYARDITRNFADKYTVSDYSKAINIFADSIEERYQKTGLNQLNENFYLLAYPKNPKSKWEYTKNFDEERGVASQLGGFPLEVHKDYHRGLIDPQRILGERWKDLPWNGKRYKEFGHWYEMNYNPLDKGSSGGLFVDKNRNAVSVKVAKRGDLSWSLPLRTKELTFWDGDKQVRTPAYDLILGGAKGQLKSYKQQVQTYILDRGGDTWLNRRNWEHKIKEQTTVTKKTQS